MNSPAVCVGISASTNSMLGIRLRKALEAVLPVQFVDLDAAPASQCDGIIAGREDRDFIETCLEKNIPAYIIDERGRLLEFNPTKGTRVDLADTPHLDGRLRGRTLVDRKSGPVRLLEVETADVVMATCEGAPIWALRTRSTSQFHVVAFKPGPLPDDQVLWQHFHRDRFLRLLPLLHFLREVARPVQWTFPPMRASLVIDDPNLHRLSYGYLDFQKLADHAQRHGYHTCLAMVPLDAWYASKRARALLRQRSAELSLTIHGVYHQRREMAQQLPIEAATAYLIDGLNRIKKFEEKYGLPVSRVMIAPFGRVSREMLLAMVETDLEGICIDGKPFPHALEPPPEAVLAGWNPSTIVEGSFPVILRDAVAWCAGGGNPFIRQDQILKAFLNQPLIFAAHHEDFRDGLGIMEELSDFVRSIAEAEWRSLDSIMRDNYCARQHGEELEVRPFSRKIRVEIPPGVTRVKVDISPMNTLGNVEVVADGTVISKHPTPHENTILVDHLPTDSMNLTVFPRPETRRPPAVGIRSHYSALGRRILCETRDRLRPIFRL